MTNPTSNFGWQMPTSTDLVTDLPADFEVFGQAVDTDFVDLLGGTTGQVLSKTSNTDLDFTWVAANPGDITGVTAGTGISGGGTSGTVTVTTSRPNIISSSVTGSGLTVGNDCTFNVFCPNMPVYKLIPGGWQIASGITTNNAYIEWSDNFYMYEWVGDA